MVWAVRGNTPRLATASTEVGLGVLPGDPKPEFIRRCFVAPGLQPGASRGMT